MGVLEKNSYYISDRNKYVINFIHLSQLISLVYGNWGITYKKVFLKLENAIKMYTHNFCLVLLYEIKM